MKQKDSDISSEKNLKDLALEMNASSPLILERLVDGNKKNRTLEEDLKTFKAKREYCSFCDNYKFPKGKRLYKNKLGKRFYDLSEAVSKTGVSIEKKIHQFMYNKLKEEQLNEDSTIHAVLDKTAWFFWNKRNKLQRLFFCFDVANKKCCQRESFSVSGLCWNFYKGNKFGKIFTL